MQTKPFTISKTLVMQAYKRVKANAGVAGVDRQSLEEFEKRLKDNLYRIWNRLSSGSYYPPAVKAVSIPKKSGGERILGVPTVSDRIAQMVIKMLFEPLIEPHFYPDSYGYRPNKSAIDAVGVTRKRCWDNDWVVEFDIKGLFDNIDHELLMKAVKKHTQDKLILLYIERWLKAPMQKADGTLMERTRGTPQGGVISPLLSNLFLHYVFDYWMGQHFPMLVWCRYADDGLVHCKTEQQAMMVRRSLEQRFAACRLELHPEKTKIVYCKDGNRQKEYSITSFEFLGYEFRARSAKTKWGNIFVNFTPAVSKTAQKAMRKTIRRSNLRNRTAMSLNEVSDNFNPMLRGWIEYYGKYHHAEMKSVYRHFNRTLIAWVMKKHKRFTGHKTRAAIYLEKIAEMQPHLFAHWKYEIGKVFA